MAFSLQNISNLQNVGVRTEIPYRVESQFSQGEQGVFYDPSDMSTMFQDAAGTQQITAVEQYVGLMLDKSKGLTLGTELVTNGDFSQGTTGWTTPNVVGNVFTISGGVATATGTTAATVIYQAGALLSGKFYKVEFDLLSTNLSGSMQVYAGNSPDSPPDAPNSVLIDVTTIGRKSCYFISNGTAFCVRKSVAFTGSIDNISVREIAGNHAYQTVTASRPKLKQDANGKYYLLFDGTDDFLVTNSIDFTATDKMTVWAGVRKLSDATIGIIVELSANASNGSFHLRSEASASWSLYSRGTASGTTTSPTTYVSPITNVLSGAGSILEDICKLRINGTQVASSTSDQGTGNYGNYRLYIGRRGGTTLPFNGQLYSLIIRGAQSSDAQIIATEKYTNDKTGAYNL